MRTSRSLGNIGKSSKWNVTTTVATPGVDTQIPTEKAVRDAIAAAGGGTVTAVADDGTYTSNSPDPIIVSGTTSLTELSKSAIDSALHAGLGGI